jgi:hypothetical protein
LSFCRVVDWFVVFVTILRECSFRDLCLFIWFFVFIFSGYCYTTGFVTNLVLDAFIGYIWQVHIYTRLQSYRLQFSNLNKFDLGWMNFIGLDYGFVTFFKTKLFCLWISYAGLKLLF